MVGKYRLDGENAEKALHLLDAVAETLERNSVSYGLDGGTLLGIVREKRLLPWDNDLDLVVPGGQEKGLLSAMTELAEAGYATSKSTFRWAYGPFRPGDMRICKVRSGEVCIDLIVKYADETHYYWQVGTDRVKKKVERRFYDSFGRIVFNDREFPVPSDVYEYLEVRYGDWKVPKMDYRYKEDDGAIIRVPAPKPSRSEAGLGSERVILALAPSIGYFGGRHADGLVIRTDVEARSVRLQVQDAKKAYLNLKKIEFHDGAGRVDFSAREPVILQSSVQERNPSKKNEALLAGKGIHSRKELRPWWEIRFSEPLRLKKIRLLNRAYYWGSRSQRLAIDVILPAGGIRRIYEGVSRRNLDRIVVALKKLTGLDVIDPLAFNLSTARLVRIGILERIAEIARSGGNGISVEGWTLMLSFTCIWSSDEPNDNELAIFAAYILAQHRANPGSCAGPRLMSMLVRSKSSVGRLRDELDSQAQAWGIEKGRSGPMGEITSSQ